MAFWLKLLITLVAILATSFVSGLVWQWLFNANMPGYLSGMVGGVSAVPVWELLKSFKTE